MLFTRAKKVTAVGVAPPTDQEEENKNKTHKEEGEEKDPQERDDNGDREAQEHQDPDLYSPYACSTRVRGGGLLLLCIITVVVVLVLSKSFRGCPYDFFGGHNDTTTVPGEQEQDEEELDMPSGGTIPHDVDAGGQTIPLEGNDEDNKVAAVTSFCPKSSSSSSSSSISSSDMVAAFEQAVLGITSLHQDLAEFTNHHLEYYGNFNPTLGEGDFDVSLYLQVLQHLSLPEGKVLEYFYVFEETRGFPVLYVRDVNTEKPFRTYQDFQEHDCEEDYPCILGGGGGGGQGATGGGGVVVEDNYQNNFFLDHHIHLDGTLESYVELIALKILGGQFYLYQQSKYYEDTVIYKNELLPYDQSSVESLAEMCACSSTAAVDWWNAAPGSHLCLSLEDLDPLIVNNVDLTPKLECDDDDNDTILRVSVVVYSNWEGFSRRVYTIDRNNGRLQDDFESEEILFFDCGYTF